MYHWTWFNLIPGVEHGEAFPFLAPESASHAQVVPTTWFVVGMISLLALVANRGLAAARARGGTLQYVPETNLGARNTLELMTGAIINLATGVLGTREAAIRYLPLMGTLFIFIFTCNILGLVPGFLPPTSNVNTNVALSLIVFVLFNFEGFRANGMGYLKHLMGPMLALAPLIFILETIGILFRPVSLSLRLFGNINGDHMVFGVFSDLTYLVIPAVFLGLGLFVSFIQAFVFTLLSIVYVGLSVAHTDDHH
jgi:F-type H+-transporting ATPase subunit a